MYTRQALFSSFSQVFLRWQNFWFDSLPGPIKSSSNNSNFGAKLPLPSDKASPTEKKAAPPPPSPPLTPPSPLSPPPALSPLSLSQVQYTESTTHATVPVACTVVYIESKYCRVSVVYCTTYIKLSPQFPPPQKKRYSRPPLCADFQFHTK